MRRSRTPSRSARGAPTTRRSSTRATAPAAWSTAGRRSPCAPSDPVRPARPLSASQHLGDEERELERLLGVEPRVAGRLVAAGEVLVRDVLRAAEALGDVFPGDLDVDAARVAAERGVHLEEALPLVHDPVEVPGLVPGGRLVGVAVHRVALPDDLVPG